MTFCGSCGTALPPATNFCPNCGASAAPVAAPSPPPDFSQGGFSPAPAPAPWAPPPYAPPAAHYPPPGYPGPEVGPRTQRNSALRTPLGIAGLVFLLMGIIALVVAGFLLLEGEGEAAFYTDLGGCGGVLLGLVLLGLGAAQAKKGQGFA